MNKSLAVGLYLTALICGTVGGALADGDDGPPGGAPEQSQGGRGHGGFPGGGGGPGGGGFKRSHGARPPKLEQVMSLKSLSNDQQTKIQAIYSDAKEEMKPLMQQMRESRERMRSGGGGAGQGGAGEPAGGPAGGPGSFGSEGGGQRRGSGEGMAQLRPIMQQLRAKREATWTKVKAVLTDAQVKELEQMRGGEQGARGRGGHGGPGGAGVQGGPGGRGQDSPQDGDEQWTRGGPPGDSDDQ